MSDGGPGSNEYGDVTMMDRQADRQVFRQNDTQTKTGTEVDRCIGIWRMTDGRTDGRTVSEIWTSRYGHT